MIKVGVVAPAFVRDPWVTLRATQAAEQAGFDGVFVPDHLFPFSNRTGDVHSALVLLGAMAEVTTSCAIGSLVLRIGNYSDEIIVSAARTLLAIAPARMVIGLGLGDAQSAPEDRAFGIDRPTVAIRAERLRGLVRALRALTPSPAVWVGGESEHALAAASTADGWNGWCAAPGVVRNVHTRLGEHVAVTWAGHFSPTAGPEGPKRIAWLDSRPQHVDALERGGSVAGGADEVTRHLHELSASGATWAIYDTPVDGWRSDAWAAIAEGRRAVINAQAADDPSTSVMTEALPRTGEKT